MVDCLLERSVLGRARASLSFLLCAHRAGGGRSSFHLAKSAVEGTLLQAARLFTRCDNEVLQRSVLKDNPRALGTTCESTQLLLQVGLWRRSLIPKLHSISTLRRCSKFSNQGALMSGDCKLVCYSGQAALSSYLAREDHRNFWELDLEALVDWLGAFYSRKIDGDPIFKQRCQITSIKRQNKSRLADVEV